MGWLSDWLDNVLMGGEERPMDLSLIEKKIPIEKHLEAGKKRIEEARKENKEEEKAEEGLKHVIDGAKLKCDLCTNPEGDLKVNFDTPTIQDKKAATIKEKDKTSLIFKGNCKKSPQSNSPCASVMQLGDWKNTGTSLIQDQPPILLKSTIKCNYGGVDIKITDCGQKCEPEEIDVVGAPVPGLESELVLVNGHFYNEDGFYLGQIGSTKDVIIADNPTFEGLKKGNKVKIEKIKNLTQISNLDHKDFLNRANWVFGEGGGVFTDRYAMTIKNLKKSGKSGYGPKPFDSEEEMYKSTMSHGNPPKTLYPDYLNGTYKGFNAQAFALAKKNPIDLNKNPKMNLAIKGVINSLLEISKNEGYNNWRGSGDTLYTEEEKKKKENEKKEPDYLDLKQKNGKVYAKVKTITDHYFEPVGKKYRRHTFKKITKENI